MEQCRLIWPCALGIRICLLPPWLLGLMTDFCIIFQSLQPGFKVSLVPMFSPVFQLPGYLMAWGELCSSHFTSFCEILWGPGRAGCQSSPHVLLSFQNHITQGSALELLCCWPLTSQCTGSPGRLSSVSLCQGFSHFSTHQNHLEFLWKHRLRPCAQRFRCSRSDPGLRVFISNELPGEANVLVSFENHYSVLTPWSIGTRLCQTAIAFFILS